MNTTLTASVILACLVAAIIIGRKLRYFLPETHLNSETKDAVKLAMGLVATMSALLLGLLVSSAKGSYDTVRDEVIQMAAKVAFLDRVLRLYGPEAAAIRLRFHEGVKEAIGQIWSEERTKTTAGTKSADEFYNALQSLSPRDETQRSLKSEAAKQAVELAQLRTLVNAQSLDSISRPLLIVVVLWLGIIFLSFSLLSPANATASLSLLISAFSVVGAIFLILEMDRPFTGIIRLSSDALVNALSEAAKPQ